MKNSLLKALRDFMLAIFIYFVVYSLYNIEYIRSKVVDFTFSYTISLLFSNKKSQEPKKLQTNIVLYKIDKNFLEKEKLYDNIYADTNYGALFPRVELVKFIKKLDSLPKNKQPLALFIDYKLDDVSTTYDVNSSLPLSYGDKEFVKELAKIREYKILLPKTQEVSFIEDIDKYINNNIADNIKKCINIGNIIFVNIGLLYDDNIAYRYLPLLKFKSKYKLYPNVALAMWQIRKNGQINMEEIYRYFPKNDYVSKDYLENGSPVIKTNILFKRWNKQDRYSKESSNWNGLMAYSASELLYKDNLDFNNSIVLIGGTIKNKDMHHTPVGDMYGIKVIANSIKTVLFLDGDLKYLNPLYASFIPLIVIIIIYLLVDILYYCAYKKSLFVRTYISKSIKFYIKIVLIGIILYMVSNYILIEYKMWFSWGVLIVILAIDEFLSMFHKGGIFMLLYLINSLIFKVKNRRWE